MDTAKKLAAAAAKEHFREFNALVKQPEPVALTDEQFAGKLNELERFAGNLAVLHHQHMGKAMPDHLYASFTRLRDDVIPALKREIRAALAASQPAPVEKNVCWELCKHCGHDMKDPCHKNDNPNLAANCHWNQEHTRVLGTGLVNNRPSAPVEAQAAPVVTDEMVGRFLGWRLPDNFSPDCLVSFDKEFAKASGSWPRGTNLLDADQAKAMLQHVLGATQEAQVVPEIDYKALIADCFRTTGFRQGEKGCIGFARGAEWFRAKVLAAAPTPSKGEA